MCQAREEHSVDQCSNAGVDQNFQRDLGAVGPYEVIIIHVNFNEIPMDQWPICLGWPRQTKPKKGQFMNFSQGPSGTKVRYVNRACFPKERHQNSQKWVKFMNFSVCPFLWFGLPGRLLTFALFSGKFVWTNGP